MTVVLLVLFVSAFAMLLLYFGQGIMELCKDRRGLSNIAFWLLGFALAISAAVAVCLFWGFTNALSELLALFPRSVPRPAPGQTETMAKMAAAVIHVVLIGTVWKFFRRVYL